MRSLVAHDLMARLRCYLPIHLMVSLREAADVATEEELEQRIFENPWETHPTKWRVWVPTTIRIIQK